MNVITDAFLKFCTSYKKDYWHGKKNKELERKCETFFDCRHYLPAIPWSGLYP